MTWKQAWVVGDGAVGGGGGDSDDDVAAADDDVYFTGSAHGA